MIDTVCFSCVHLGEQIGMAAGSAVYACKAFPNGIPTEVLTSKEPHLRPRPGDRGIIYSPRPGARSLASFLRDLEAAEREGDFDDDGELALC